MEWASLGTCGCALARTPLVVPTSARNPLANCESKHSPILHSCGGYLLPIAGYGEPRLSCPRESRPLVGVRPSSSSTGLSAQELVPMRESRRTPGALPSGRGGLHTAGRTTSPLAGEPRSSGTTTFQVSSRSLDLLLERRAEFMVADLWAPCPPRGGAELRRGRGGDAGGCGCFGSSKSGSQHTAHHLGESTAVFSLFG